jgi:hypothetical protein
MPLVQTRGAASAQGFGEFAQVTAPVYIEDVFSTYIYTGNGATQTITNGIDLSGKGGLVWFKNRDQTTSHQLYDTLRGATYALQSDQTSAQSVRAGSLTAFNSNGFDIGSDGDQNASTRKYVSWTFRKQPKFFDVVTYTGNGAGGRDISHNLKSAPGAYFVKRTDAAGNWWTGQAAVELANGGNPASTSANFALNTTNRYAYTGAPYSVWAFGSSATNFYVNDQANISGATYVAYLFANNAGGFGLTGLDNVISCGTATWNSSGVSSVTLGYEPQWVMIKSSSGNYGWWMADNMRGMPATNDGQQLNAEGNYAESSSSLVAKPTATGFRTTNGAASETYLYIAIRRGPMKVPTDATKVYTANPYTATDTDGRLITSGFPVDAAIIDPRNGYSTPGGPNWFSRLTGNGYFLQTASTNAESNGSSNSNGIMGQDGITVSRTGTNVWSNVGSNTYVPWFFRRAPSFFDEVCYTGTGSNTAQAHNLGVIPELVIVKARGSVNNWLVYNAIGGVGNTLRLQTAGGYIGGSPASSLTSTSVTYGYDANYLDSCSANGTNYVAYLFATCAGVSKVGGYTGTGTLTTINCGFTGGARFVLIKRTDASSDWFVWDTARGMVSGTDPSLALNSIAAESNANSVYTATTGFQLLASPSKDVNTSGGTYIFLAIA